MELLSTSVQLLELRVYVVGVGFLTAFSFCNCNDGIMALADETTLNSELTWVIYCVQYIPTILIVSSGLFIYETSERK